MSRLLAPLAPAVLALALLTAPAGAKEYTALKLCGANGCHTTHDKAALTGAMSVDQQASPDHGGAFYRLRFMITHGGQTEGFVRSQWIPSVGLIRNADGPLVEFSLPHPATERMLRALSRGLRPLPAARLGRLNGAPAGARVDEVVAAPKADHDDSGGDSKGWMWSGLAILPALIAFILVRRRRRMPSPAQLP
jgi:hypothetical protein